MNIGHIEGMFFLISGYLEKEEAEKLTSEISIKLLEKEKIKLKGDLEFFKNQIIKTEKEIDSSNINDFIQFNKGVKAVYEARIKDTEQRIDNLNEQLIYILK
jgi:hypothetical protein